MTVLMDFFSDILFPMDLEQTNLILEQVILGQLDYAVCPMIYTIQFVWLSG